MAAAVPCPLPPPLPSRTATESQQVFEYHRYRLDEVQKTSALLTDMFATTPAQNLTDDSYLIKMITSRFVEAKDGSMNPMEVLKMCKLTYDANNVIRFTILKCVKCQNCL